MKAAIARQKDNKQEYLISDTVSIKNPASWSKHQAKVFPDDIADQLHKELMKNGNSRYYYFAIDVPKTVPCGLISVKELELC